MTKTKMELLMNGLNVAPITANEMAESVITNTSSQSTNHNGSLNYNANGNDDCSAYNSLCDRAKCLVTRTRANGRTRTSTWVATAAAAAAATGTTLAMATPNSSSVVNSSSTIASSGGFSDLIETNETMVVSDGGEYVPYGSRPETYIVPIIFLFIFVVGTIGNGTVIYIFYQHKSMRTVANVYILSLAVGDLALILISVPFVSTIYTFESWPYGLLVCKISEFARDLSIGVTVFTLTSLSVQRYTATHHPIRYLSHKGRATLTQANTFIWLLAMVLAMPGAYNSFIMTAKVNAQHTIHVCYPFPAKLGPWYPKMIVIVKFMSYYAIPLIVITIFYSLMARSLIRTTENPVCKNDSHHKLLKNRRKISRIVLGLVVIFALCFFPNQVFMLWYHFNPNANENYNAFWHVWRIIGFVLSFLNSCLNPIVLCCISGLFRSHFKRYIFSCFKQGTRSREASITPGFRSINSIDLNTKNEEEEEAEDNQPAHNLTTVSAGPNVAVSGSGLNTTTTTLTIMATRETNNPITNVNNTSNSNNNNNNNNNSTTNTNNNNKPSLSQKSSLYTSLC